MIFLCVWQKEISIYNEEMIYKILICNSKVKILYVLSEGWFWTYRFVMFKILQIDSIASLLACVD